MKVNPKVVILGAGYGGLLTTIRLQKLVGVNEVDITLVNKNDYHYETTWLHEASAGTMHHDKVRYDIEPLLNRNKVNFIQETVTKVDLENQTVELTGQSISYDYLVFALGGEPETFGIKGLKEHAFTISNVNSSRQLREHIEYQFANFHVDEDKKHERLAIVVGGAGFTGIEFLGELVNRIPKLCDDYDVDKHLVKIYCVEAAPTVLPGFDSELVNYARSYLEEKGVEFHIGTAIKECTEEGVIVAKGDAEPTLIRANTVVWAAGVRGSSVISASGFDNIRDRVTVDQYLRYPKNTNVFVIGDSSAVINEENGRPYPPTAQIAMQQAVVVVKNIMASIRGGQLEEFKFDNKGTVCSLGHDNAIGVVFGKKITGFSASFMKKVIDNRALFLIGGPGLVMKKGKFKVF